MLALLFPPPWARPGPGALAAGLLAACVLAGPLAVAAEPPEPETLAALHWFPETAPETRRLTTAVALVLAESAALDENWIDSVESRRLLLARLAARVPPERALAVDGRFGGLVLARELSPLEPAEGETGPPARFVEGPRSRPPVARSLPVDDTAAFRAARLGEELALDPVKVWRELERRLAAGAELPGIPDAWWAGALEAWGETDDEAGARYAGEQAEWVLARAGAGGRASLWTARIRAAHIERLWQLGRPLPALWRGLEAIERALEELSPADAPDLALFPVPENLDPARLRQVDPALPVVLEMLAEAAALWSEDAAPALIRAELADAYARLALFSDRASDYLDQPVRERIRLAIGRCGFPVAPRQAPPRDAFEACLDGLFELLEAGLDSDELTGGGAGPFAEEFLGREMELTTWQRVDYLSGHLNWLLGGTCPATRSVNPLEWSLISELLAYWGPLRPADFAAARWQQALDRALARGLDEAGIEERIGCLATEEDRRDPMLRLADRHRRLLQGLETELGAVTAAFRAEHLKPGADVSLEPGHLLGQATAYRPEGLVLGPCDPARACGARASLEVSRALVGLFPNAYLLADQLGMGDIRLCYDRVRWVDRRQLPARYRDPQVANYAGRLSFELVGRFEPAAGVEAEPEVFRIRMTDERERHYFFSAADPRVLEMECPLSEVGEPIESRLTDPTPGIVPKRLTYFSNAPVTPEDLIVANWARGAEWRDWFVAGERVERLDLDRGEALMPAVNLKLQELSQRRERMLSQRLLRSPSAAESDPLGLAMSRLADSSDLMRGVAELFWPVEIRHDSHLRALLAGTQGLLNRDRVRLLRDAGVSMLELPAVGRGRLEVLEAHWRALPPERTWQGQPVPELIDGIENLRRLEALIPPAPVDGEAGQEAPDSTP